MDCFKFMETRPEKIKSVNKTRGVTNLISFNKFNSFFSNIGLFHIFLCLA